MEQIYRFRYILYSIPFAFSVISLSANTTEYLFSFRMIISVIIAILLIHNILCGIRLKHTLKNGKKAPEEKSIPAGWLTEGNVQSFLILNILLYLSATWFINLWVFIASPLVLLILAFFQTHRPKQSIREFCSTYWPSLVPIALWFLITESASWTPTLLSVVIFFSTWGYIRICGEERLFGGTIKTKNNSFLLIALAVVTSLLMCIFLDYEWAAYLATFLFGLILSIPYMNIAKLRDIDKRAICLCIYFLASIVFNAIFIFEWRS